jgi:hypothetical protein
VPGPAAGRPGRRGPARPGTGSARRSPAPAAASAGPRLCGSRTG